MTNDDDMGVEVDNSVARRGKAFSAAEKKNNNAVDNDDDEDEGYHGTK